MDLLDDDEYLYNPYDTAAVKSEDEVEDDDATDITETESQNALQTHTASQIFSLTNVSWKAKQHGGARIKHMAATGPALFVATDRGKVVRWHLGTGDEHEMIIDKGRNDVIFKLHVDPQGQHLIIGGNQGENWYVAIARSLKPRLIAMARGARIESVSWDRDGGDDSTTGVIMIGTSTGTICKTCIVDGKEKFWKEIFSLQDAAQPICGLQYELFPPSGKGYMDMSKKYFVMAATPTRYYEFIGGPTYDALFAQYSSAPAFIELPGDLDYSELHFFRKENGRASSFVWLTGPGIYSGSFSFGSQNAGDSIIHDYKLIPYSNAVHGSPLSLLSTEFHWFLLFPDRLQVINQLTQEVAWEHMFTSRNIYGDMRGMMQDPITGKLWVYADFMINEVVITNEDQNVWRCYLAKGQYDTALQYCKDLSQREKVLTAQADHFFSEKQWELAASMYAKTKRSFEEITLKFITLNEKDALKRYLSDKLDNMRATDKAQLTMICTWLCEMYLDKLNSVKDTGSEAQYGYILDEFRHFLQDNVANFDPETTYQLILNHGRMDVMLYYAELNGDHDRVISHHVQRREWTKALDVLAKCPDASLYYVHSPTLMQHAPVGTTNAWINATRQSKKFLDPRKLVPALMRYNIANNPPGHKANQALRFLQHCVKNLDSRDAVVLNYLVTLLCQQDDEKAMLAFLADYGGAGGRIDLQYALRACQQSDKKEACVHILASLHQYEQAVDLALEIRDIELAKLNADKVEDDDDLRKRLWLRIARYVIEEEKDVRKAIAFIGQTEHLKVEDILPFFPDFALIDDFKEAICTSLEEYHEQIEELKQGMEEATRSAELIRKDITDLRGRFGFVRSSQKCGFCRQPVLAAGLYLFPCQHGFHISCQEQWMLQEHLGHADKKRVRELKAAIVAEEAKGAHNSAADGTQAGVDRMRVELDDILASDCPLCGNPAIDMTAKPLPDLPQGPAFWDLPPLRQ
mmetsp:Transcript_59942/g.141174  ORF Transcript_59942/g.141174 Transcript_59942/m.141174 type:complete len:974 (+) Transcript_59942:154-3075(+)